MFLKLYLLIRKYLLKIDDRSELEKAVEKGLTIGNDCNIQWGVILDPSHCFLITIGDRVTLAPRVHVLAHDASTKRILGYTVIGKVVIGNDVFIGAGTIILPNVTIGDKVIIGAGSVVTHSIPNNSVAVGNPAKVIGTYDAYVQKRKDQFKLSPKFDESYVIGMITEEKKQEMRNSLSNNNIGFIR